MHVRPTLQHTSVSCPQSYVGGMPGPLQQRWLVLAPCRPLPASPALTPAWCWEWALTDPGTDQSSGSDVDSCCMSRCSAAARQTGRLPGCYASCGHMLLPLLPAVPQCPCLTALCTVASSIHGCTHSAEQVDHTNAVGLQNLLLGWHVRLKTAVYTADM